MIADIARPSNGDLALPNIYVALSRSTGRNHIRILRGFDDDAVLKPLDTALAAEDERPEQLDRDTSAWWAGMNHT